MQVCVLLGATSYGSYSLSCNAAVHAPIGPGLMHQLLVTESKELARDLLISSHITACFASMAKLEQIERGMHLSCGCIELSIYFFTINWG